MTEVLMDKLEDVLDKIQSVLDFHGVTFVQFNNTRGLGRIGLGGFVVGIVFGFNLALLLSAFSSYIFTGTCSAAVAHWALYCVLLSLFHFLEFFVTALYQPGEVSYDSFVINHSKQYTLAAIVSAVEYWIGALLFPGLKHSAFWMFIGFVLMIGGQTVRTIAMCTARSNFSHHVMETRKEGHKLVTHGIYSVLRHPSYFGWFWWSIGTQLLLCNVISFAGYAWASWSFFRNRIPGEELSLMQFYPDQYPAYMSRTYVGIPGIAATPQPPQRNTAPRAQTQTQETRPKAE